MFLLAFDMCIFVFLHTFSANATYLGTSVVGSRDHHIHAHTYMDYNDEYESYIRTTATMDGVPLVSIFLPVNPDGCKCKTIYVVYVISDLDTNTFCPMSVQNFNLLKASVLKGRY